MDRTLALPPVAPPTVHAHLSAGDLAAMIDGQLPADRRAIVEAHLAVCAECRAELTESIALLDSVPARPRLRGPWMAGAAAAALALTALPFLGRPKVITPADEGRSSVPSDVRAATPITTGVNVIAPVSDAKVSGDSLSFRWHAVAGVTTYQLFVTDSAGAPVYSLTTADTSAQPADAARLVHGARYFWYIDALASDGSSVTSPHVGFVIRPQ